MPPDTVISMVLQYHIGNIDQGVVCAWMKTEIIFTLHIDSIVWFQDTKEEILYISIIFELLSVYTCLHKW